MNARGSHYILNAAGEPVPTDVITWAHWFEKADRHVGLTHFEGDVRVSTVFLGLDHNFSRQGQPILWETLVFGGPLEGEMYRYSSRMEAMRGHEEMCQRVREAGDGYRQIDLE